MQDMNGLVQVKRFLLFAHPSIAKSYNVLRGLSLHLLIVMHDHPDKDAGMEACAVRIHQHRDRLV
jgi:hypothetical protein